MELNLENYRTPGQLVEFLLRERGWSKRVLAVATGVDETGLNHRLSNKRPVNAKFAIALEEVFGVPAEAFLELQKRYDLANARIVTRPDLARQARAALFSELPIAEMIKRRWIIVDDIREIEALESELAKFFQSSNINEVSLIPHAAKKSQPNEETSAAQLAWLFRVKNIASGLLCPPFDKGATIAAIPRLKALLSAPEEARHAPKILSECGIRFVAVEALKGSKIDGVCLWLNEKSPVIAMTMRFDRIDNFWFVLRHEIEHVIQGHGIANPKIDIDVNSARVVDSDEQMANLAAAEFCAPQARVNSFIARKAPLFAERDFLGLAKILAIHPGLLAGQIQFKTDRFDLFRSHITKIRECVLPSMIVDGWGDIPPPNH